MVVFHLMLGLILTAVIGTEHQVSAVHNTHLPYYLTKYSNAIFPSIFCTGCGIEGWHGFAHVFLHFGLSKYIHFLTPITTRCRKPFLFCLGNKISQVVSGFQCLSLSLSISPRFIWKLFSFLLDLPNGYRRSEVVD